MFNAALKKALQAVEVIKTLLLYVHKQGNANKSQQKTPVSAGFTMNVHPFGK